MYGMPHTLTDMTNTSIGIPDKVRGVAVERGYTQDRIARLLDISRTQLVERYAGRVDFRAGELLKLAIDMRVPVERFFPTEAELRAAEQLQAVAS